jgi:hypothetical protein
MPALVDRVKYSKRGKSRSGFDLLFQLMNNLGMEKQQPLWIANPEADENPCDIMEDLV